MGAGDKNSPRRTTRVPHGLLIPPSFPPTHRHSEGHAERGINGEGTKGDEGARSVANGQRSGRPHKHMNTPHLSRARKRDCLT